MQQINFRKFTYWQYQHELVKDNGLTCQQGVIYSYFFNHCVNLNKNGYCGYSDQRMATELGMTVPTFKRELGILKEKRLIIIKNEGKRSKKAGESREIYINSENYLVDEPKSDFKEKALQRELEQANKTIEKLQKQIEELQKLNQPNRWGVYLVKTYKFMTTEQYMENCAYYNDLLNELVMSTDEEYTHKAFKRYTKHSKRIKHHKAYLTKSVEDSIRKYKLYQTDFMGY